MNSTIDTYKEAKAKLEQAKLNKARAEANIETTDKQMKEVEANILKTAGTETIEEAVEKLNKLRNKIGELLEEATEILNG